MKRFIILIGILTVSFSAFSQNELENLTIEQKIFGLSKIWKEADKNFVFFDQVPDLDWDKTYQEFIPKVISTKTTYEYYKQLQKFCSLLKDGHTSVVIPWKLRKTNDTKPPLETKFVNGKIYVSKILNDTLRNTGLKEGLEIIEIDGVNIHKYANERIKPYVFYSTKQDMNIQVYEYKLLRGDINKPFKIKCTNGKVYTILRSLSTVKTKSPIFDFKTLENNVGHLKINRFYGDNLVQKFDSIYSEILKTDKLIIDVSENFGGNSGYANYVLKHIIDKQFETARWKTLMYMPSYASWGYNTQWQDNYGDKVKPKENIERYSNEVVVLISEKTYSAGEDFVVGFINSKRGTVIGRPTAGTTGNPIGFSLPGKGGFQICSKRDYFPNGTEFVGFGIMPDKTIQNSIDGNHLINGALEILK